jgi:hypothetical protein
MQPTTRLKLASIAFSVLWTCWMVWSTDSFDWAGIVILTVCGILAGVGCYIAMSFAFRLMRPLPTGGKSRARG